MEELGKRQEARDDCVDYRWLFGVRRCRFGVRRWLFGVHRWLFGVHRCRFTLCPCHLSLYPCRFSLFPLLFRLSSCLVPLAFSLFSLLLINPFQLIFKQRIRIIIKLNEIRFADLSRKRSIIMSWTRYIVSPNQYITKVHFS